MSCYTSQPGAKRREVRQRRRERCESRRRARAVDTSVAFSFPSAISMGRCCRVIRQPLCCRSDPAHHISAPRVCPRAPNAILAPAAHITLDDSSMPPRSTAPALVLPSLLSDLSALSSQPSLLPSLPPSSPSPLPSSPSSSSAESASLAVQVAEEFLRGSELLLEKVELGTVEGLRERIDQVELGVREVQGGLMTGEGQG